jgi:hypothetical protein
MRWRFISSVRRSRAFRGPLVRGAEVEIVDGVYRVRYDEPTPPIGAAL